MHKSITRLFLLLCAFGAFGVIASAQTSEVVEGFAVSERPKPAYTERARKKKVQGTVRLRVTFNADGTIGGVQDVTEKKREKMAKYGLTATAIEAAKHIKFEPARKNGVPITVKKTVEYVFTLY